MIAVHKSNEEPRAIMKFLVIHQLSQPNFEYRPVCCYLEG